MEKKPLVSIQCTVYNHEPFLRQCLDGFVMQQTTFPFEAIVHDDASTDDSAAIIREYAEKYPDIIKPIYETENQYSKHDGSLARIMEAAMHPNSKYIAHCEGDDYWTDPHKLQIQVDFLESHQDYYFTCHAYELFFETTKEFKSHRFVESLPLHVFEGRKYCTPSMDDFWNGPWFTQLLTIVRRRSVFIDEVKLKKYTRSFDYIICYYMMKSGKCALFKDIMGVYRKHGGGVFSGRKNSDWIELELDNYYCMYELEKEKRVLPILDESCAEMFLSKIKDREFKKALMIMLNHMRKVPFKHSVFCATKILNLSIRSLMRKIRVA